MYRERLEALNRQIAAMTATDDERLCEAEAEMQDMHAIFDCMQVISLHSFYSAIPGMDLEACGVGEQAVYEARRAAATAIYSINDRAKRYGAPQVFETDRSLIDILLDLHKDYRAHSDGQDDSTT